MKPLIVLLVSFLIALISIRILNGDYETALAARIAMSLMLVFTMIGHFAFTAGMLLMVPEMIPYKKAFVYFTGVVELLAAIGLLISKLQVLTGWLLICFFILLLPANINAAVKHIDYQKADRTGSGPSYLWFRVPLQLLFIAWVYFAAIRS